MKIVIHASSKISWQKRYAFLLQKGLLNKGIKSNITESNKSIPCDIPIIMGPNMYKNIEVTNPNFLMLNRKFLGENVDDWVSISWNGFNGLGKFCVEDISKARLWSLIPSIEKSKTEGKNFVLIEQSNIARSIKFSSLEDYYNYAIHNYSPIIRKPKPLGEETISLQQNKIFFEKNNTKAIVNLNSTISVEGIVLGYSIISLDEQDPVYSCGKDRESFLHYLAHCQWHISEIASGEFWDRLYPCRGIRLNEYKI